MAVKASFEADFSKWLDGIRAVNGSLEQLQAVVGTTDRSVDAMSKRFDGTKVIGEATKMVSAVQDIGGAARLTDSEARRVNATVTEAIEKMQRLGGTAPPEMLKLRDATSRTNNELNQQPSMMEKINAKTVALGTAFGSFLGNMAWSAVNKLGAELNVFVERGLQFGALESSFQRLAAGAGQSSSEMIASLKEGSRGLVSEYDLMTSANKAMLLGLPVTSASMGNLAGAATTLGKAMGLSATKSLEDLITALGRSSPMILDNLGLTVKVGEANEKYAEELNITVDQLTDADKKMAFYVEAMRKAEAKTRELGEQTKTLGEIFQTKWVSIGDIVTRTVSSMNIGLGAALSSFENFGKFLELWAKGGLTLAVNTIAAIEQTKNVIAPLNETQQALVRLNSVMGDNRLSAEELAKKFGTNVASVLAYTTKLTREKADADAAAADKANELAEKVKKQNEAFQKQVDVLTGKALAREVAELAKQYRAAQEAGGLNAYQTEVLSKKLAEMRAQGALLPPEFMKLAIAYEDSNRKALPVVSTLKSIDDAMKAVYATAMSSPPESLIVTPLVTSTQTALKAVQQHALQAAPPVALSFSSRFGEMMGTQLPQAIMAAIQGGGSVIEAAGSTIGSFLVSDKGIGKSLAAGAKDLFGNKLGGMIASALPGLGAMLGPALSGLFNKLFGSAGRDAVKEFASTFGGFDALREKLNALGAEGERLWVQLTQGTGKNNKAQAEAAIRAIQEAFARAEEEARKLREEIAGIESELADLRSKSEPTFRDMEAAAKAFGVELSRLGPAFQQQRLTDRAREIYDAFDTLRRGGADTTVILEGMADEINDLVLQSLKFGTTIPENFRPLIQSLLESGQLVDENGEKLTDLGQIRFGDAVKSQWEVIADRIKDLTDALQKLVEKLNGPLVDAAKNVAREFGNLPSEIDVRLRVGRPGDAEGDELPQFATGTKGVTGRYFQNFGAGKLAMLHGNEAVVPQSQAQQFADAVGGGNGDVVAELSALRSDFVAMPRLIARAVRDAILVAG